MTDKEFLDLVQRHAVDIAAVLMLTPKVYGDAARVTIKTKHRTLNDVLINTMSGRVEIGEDCMFGHGVMLITGTHDHTKRGEERRAAVPREGRDIIIDEGVWLASGVIVLGPARIGKHAVVAAGSLVRGDVSAYAIYAGNPAAMVGEVPR